MCLGAPPVLCCAHHATLVMGLNLRAVALLGLLDLDETSIPEPKGAPETVEHRGHWRIEHHAAVSVWRCLCGRSDPLVIPSEFRKRVRLPHDLVQACEVCRSELASCSSRASRLHAWLERNRPLIDPDTHLEYPEDRGYTYSDDDGQSTRTRRFIYEAFFKTKLRSSDFVRSRCSNPFCINPYHLCITSTPNQKTSPQIERMVLHLQDLGISAKITQRVILQKFEIKLSLSTIQGIRAGSKRLLATAA
jgi:hypothetical protein